jgi:hypothetical protein
MTNSSKFIVSSSLLALFLGCSPAEELLVGVEQGADARLTADLYTWDCTNEESDWMGVLGFDIALEFVPDNLNSRALPPVGSCAYAIDMFALDALQSGDDLPGATGMPTWSTDAMTGDFMEVGPGLWFSDVFRNVLSCDDSASVITSGVEVQDAGVFSGMTSPTAGEITSITSNNSSLAGFPFGELVELDWEASGWDETFVQLRRERNGVAYEVVTCNTSGLSAFTINDSTWEMLNPEIVADTNLLYVGFQNRLEEVTEYGQELELVARALHVVGINIE